MSASDPNPLLVVEHASRSFGARRALAGVSLALQAGEVYALLGPNGAGKTSLIRALCGRLRLDAGQVRLGGEDPRRPAARRVLGLVPQELALFPELTVRENLQILGRWAGLERKGAPAAVDAALRWIGLADRGHSPAAQLSGGMQRRVNLVAGVLHSPRVLLLDEPTVGIDPPARERIHDLLRDLRGRGLAILLTTHDLDQAAELADRVGIIVEGRIRAEGAPAELVRSAFGNERELRVGLVSAPGAEAEAALRGEGLAASPDPRTWIGSTRGGLEALASLGRRLAESRVPVAELRLREPDLRGVFFRVAGREMTE